MIKMEKTILNLLFFVCNVYSMSNVYSWYAHCILNKCKMSYVYEMHMDWINWWKNYIKTLLDSNIY
jgi:hypothetical protein